ncbi:TPA: hypothetical protein ACOZ3K_004172 [Yersinia enterocolitica]
MFVSKKKYDLLLTRYELAASRADQLERPFTEFECSCPAHGNGWLYKCILECREAAQAIAQPGSEDLGMTIDRMAFIDRYLNKHIPVLARRMPDFERQMWEDALKRRAADIYVPPYRYCQQEGDA